MNVGALMSSRRAQIVAVVAFVLVYLLAAWFLFVSPKRAEALPPAGRGGGRRGAARGRTRRIGKPAASAESRVGSVQPREGNAGEW